MDKKFVLLSTFHPPAVGGMLKMSGPLVRSKSVGGGLSTRPGDDTVAWAYS